MNLENYVCTLEQAKKIKKLGVERESFFVYYTHEAFPITSDPEYIAIERRGTVYEWDETFIEGNAYTSQELGCVEMVAFIILVVGIFFGYLLHQAFKNVD